MRIPIIWGFPSFSLVDWKFSPSAFESFQIISNEKQIQVWKKIHYVNAAVDL